jgi:hypothetical protein
MITIKEYASLAAHVYRSKSDIIQNLPIGELSTEKIKIKPIPSDKKAVDWYCLPDVDPRSSTTNHFYAQLYVKFQKGKAVNAVIAIRGTEKEDWHNLTVDFFTWWSDVVGDGGRDSDILLSSYLMQAMSFYNRVRKYLKEYFPGLKIFAVTGHSLGGAIAQLLPLQAGYPVRAICFNSSGCKNIPGVKIEHSGWVHNVNAIYDLVSKVGVIVGDLRLVEVHNSEKEIILLYQKLNHELLENAKKLSTAGKQSVLPGSTHIELTGYSASTLALVETLIALNKAEPDLHLHYLYCEKADKIIEWKKASQIQASCTELEIFKSYLKTYEAIIMDQHSIFNLLTALNQEENLSIAQTFVV